MVSFFAGLKKNNYKILKQIKFLILPSSEKKTLISLSSLQISSTNKGNRKLKITREEKILRMTKVVNWNVVSWKTTSNPITRQTHWERGTYAIEENPDSRGKIEREKKRHNKTKNSKYRLTHIDGNGMDCVIPTSKPTHPFCDRYG